MKQNKIIYILLMSSITLFMNAFEYVSSHHKPEWKRLTFAQIQELMTIDGHLGLVRDAYDKIQFIIRYKALHESTKQEQDFWNLNAESLKRNH